MLCLHATSDPAGQPWVGYSIEDRYAPLILRTILYMARTELFVVISCFLLLHSLESKPRPYAQCVKVQAKRLLLPFLFWTAFFAVYNLIKADVFGYYSSAVSKLSEPHVWIGYLVLGDVKYHMHFLPTLFGIVLFYPFFRLAVRYPSLGLSVLAFLVVKHQLDAFVFSQFWGTEALSYLVRGIKILTYVGYGMMAGGALGIWQRTTATERREWFPLLIFFGCILLLFKLIATWQTAQRGEWEFDYLPGFWADFLFPIVLFGGCMALSYLSWPNVISKIAPYSFGLYLCHPIFHDIYEIMMQQDNANLSPIYQVLLKIGFTMIATSTLVFIISKIKFLAWTIGLGPLPRLRSNPPSLRKEVPC